MFPVPGGGDGARLSLKLLLRLKQFFFSHKLIVAIKLLSAEYGASLVGSSGLRDGSARGILDGTAQYKRRYKVGYGAGSEPPQNQ